MMANFSIYFHLALYLSVIFVALGSANAGGEYWKAETGINCPLGEVVISEAECRDAASQLEMQYLGKSTGDGRPAGCYFWNLNVYFNTEITPSLTPVIGSRGGVCIRQDCPYVTLNGHDIPWAVPSADVCNSGYWVGNDAECQAGCDTCAECDAWITNTPLRVGKKKVFCWLVGRDDNSLTTEVDATRNMGIKRCD